MLALKLLLAVLSVCAVTQPAFAQFKVGDRLVVIAPTEIRVGDKFLQVLGRGQDFRVDAINGDFLWVKHLTTGWISTQFVRTPAEALDVFTGQIRWNPLDAGAFYARAITKTDLNQIDAAIDDFNEAIRLDPKQSCAFNGRGICWDASGDEDKAIADYTEAIRLDPNGAAVSFVNRAIAWNSKGEPLKAIADTTEAIRIAPRYASAFSVRAQASAALKQFDKATADCEEVRKISLMGLSGYNDVAWFLATSPDAGVRDGKKAVEFATKACELTNWDDSGVLDTCAVAYAEIGDFDQAVKWETKAIQNSAERDRTNLESRLNLFKTREPYREETN